MNDDNHKTLQEFAMGEIIKELRAERDALKAELEKLKFEADLRKHTIESLQSAYSHMTKLKDSILARLKAARKQEPDSWRITASRFCGTHTTDKDVAIYYLAQGLAYPLYASPVPAQQSAEVNQEYPMQPMFLDKGLPRFEKNPIIDRLCEKHGLNEIGIWWQVNNIERKYIEQLYQLIGYSIRGYDELSEVSDASFDKAKSMAEQLLKGGENER